MARRIHVAKLAALLLLAASACKFPPPADVPDDDVTDGDAHVVDAVPADRPVDVPLDAPRVPLVTNFQAADLVIGQPNFTADAFASRSATTMFFPNGVAATVDALWAVELQGRALRYSPLPEVNQPSANLVIGARSFTANPPPAAVNGIEIDFSNVCGIGVGGGKTLVTDAGRNRILVWGFPPSANGEAASFALGQPNFTSTTPGNGRTQLRSPAGIWTDGTKLMVADAGNHRVLIWYSFPGTFQDPPSVVIGQPDFGLGSAPNLPSASRLNSPYCVYSDGQRVFVSDSGHRRVLIWSSLPQVSGVPADIVVGQHDFMSNADGHSADGMSFPYGLATTANALVLVDGGNHRVLVYDPIPTGNGAAATEVLGQPAPDKINPAPTVSASTFSGPTGLAVVGRSLFVADSGRHRVLRFRLARP